MAKEFNAETCTAEEGIINCIEVEIENAETDKDRKRIAKSIKDAVRDKHINADDANKLLAKLGVEIEPSPANDKTANEDRLYWEKEQHELRVKLDAVNEEVDRLKEELKDARAAAKSLETAILDMARQGSKGFKSGRLF